MVCITQYICSDEILERVTHMIGAIFVLFLLPVLIFLTSLFLYVLSGKEKGEDS